LPGPPSALSLLVGDGCRRSVEFRYVDSEWLVIGPGPILQDTECNLLAQQHRPVGRTAEVDAGVDPVTKRDVVRQLVQFSVDIQIVSVRTSVSIEQETICTWHDQVPAGVGEQRTELLIAVKEEFEHRDARTADRSVARRVTGMGRRTLWKCLW